jgi:positive regulator of sigma E activity
MTGTGKVTKINGNFVTIRCKASLACHSCGRAGCAVSGSRDIVAHNSRGLPLKTGDYVELRLPAFRTASSALRVFGLPAAAFAVFYFAAGRLWGEAENARVLSGLAGCVLGAFLVSLWGRRKAAFPEVARALPPIETGQTHLTSEVEKCLSQGRKANEEKEFKPQRTQRKEKKN